MNSGVKGSEIVRPSTRILDYVELMKPELTGLSVLTTLCAFYLASEHPLDVWRMIWTGVGTLLVGGGAGALNQYVERTYDALMKRTERRPLPSGRLQPIEVLVFGCLTSVVGLAILQTLANTFAAGIAAATLVLYLFLYTPLKRITWFNTIVGAIPGALPTLIGWVSARNEVTVGGLVFFSILFVWQMPHFLSLAWMYKKDYSRAGYKMLTVLDDDRGSRTSRQVLIYCAMLVPLSVGFTVIGMTGLIYLVGALIVSGAFVWSSALFSQASWGNNPVKVNSRSRQVFFASLLYLPALMVLMVLDRL